MNADKPADKAQRKNRRLGIAFIFSFTISVLFPIIASGMNRDNKVLSDQYLLNSAYEKNKFVYKR